MELDFVCPGVKMSEKLFVWDLDDTLIDNVHDFSQPILDATRLIVEELGNVAPHVTKIINFIQEIDSRRVKEINPRTGKLFLFSMDRFPGSLVEAGYKGILIPVETWDVIGRMDEVLSKVDRERCFVFGDIMEIKEKYEELV